MVKPYSGSASALADSLHLCPAMAECVENGPASGASAVKLGYMAIASGMCDRVLVVGGEKMNGRGGAAATDFVATMLHPEAEYNCGLTLTSFAAMFTRLIMERYGVTMEDLARVAVKNHANAMHNPYAQLHKRVTLEELTQGELRDKMNPLVADPLRRYDICPMSDGAAAVLLCAMGLQERRGTRSSAHCWHRPGNRILMWWPTVLCRQICRRCAWPAGGLMIWPELRRRKWMWPNCMTRFRSWKL